MGERSVDDGPARGKCPARYRIRVQGYLDPDATHRLSGMSIENGTDGEHAPVSTLTGELRDQAALIGILNTLYSYQLPVLSVERLGREDEG